jgi:hypothetical protein
MMMASQNTGLVKMLSADTPLLIRSVLSSPAGPTANTVPTMMSRITENTRMTFFMTSPR